jgi:hypothetical protein
MGGQSVVRASVRSAQARLIAVTALLAAVLAASVGVAPSSAASAATTYEATAYAYDTATYAYDGPVLLSSPDTVATGARGSPSGPGAACWVSPVSVRCVVVAANTAARADIAGARFAQSSYSEMFSSGGRFAGQSIDDVAGSLRSGALSPKDVPIDVIVRDGNSLILNTRSSQALIRAGFPRSSWKVIDRTGQAAFEARLSGQLSRNGLTSYGTDLP